MLSVIIPARNEAANIERTVRGFLAQTYHPIEIIVVDDRSTDGTGAILDAMAQDDSRLKIIRGAETPDGWLGKPWALEQGQRIAEGEILLFVDADIVYEPDAVAAAIEHLRDTGVAMLALLPHIVMKTAAENIVLPQLAMSVFSFLPTWFSNRTKIPLLGIGGGIGNIVWRRDYDAVGGHEALRSAVVDDVGLARLVRRSGRRTVVARAEDLVSVRIYAGLSEVIDGFTKNFFAVLNRNYLWMVLFLAGSVVFHLLPYALAIAGSATSLVTVALITVTRLILWRALRYPLSYALWAHPPMIVLWMWIGLRSMWFTGIRKRLVWRGRSYDAGRTRFGA